MGSSHIVCLRFVKLQRRIHQFVKPTRLAVRSALTVFLLLLFVVCVPAQTQEAARAELQRRGIEFTEDEFVRYVIGNDIATVDLFLNAGMNPNAKNRDGNVALWFAAGKGHAEIVNKLLERGANPNLSGVKNRVAWVGAVTTAQIPVLELLFKRGVDLNARAGDNQETALIFAVALSDENPNHKLIALRLLELGADPNLATKSGATALIIAAELCDLELTKALLAHGANVNFRSDNGNTPLTSAVSGGYDPETRKMKADAPAVVRALLAHGADVNATDSDGKTPLQLAKKDRTAELILALLEPQVKSNKRMQANFWAHQFTKWQGWFGPVIYLLAVILASIGLSLPKKPERAQVEDGDGLPKLAPLKCQQCAAPVPIVPDRLECPNCATPIKVPEDYSATVSLRAKAAEQLRQAERQWRRVWRYHSPFVMITLLVLGVLWAMASTIGIFSDFTVSRPLWLFVSMILSGITFSLALLAYALYLYNERDLLPALPVIGREVGESEIIGCRLCAAPVSFAPNELSSCCRYCGSENYRVARARRARHVAAAEESSAAISLYDAMVGLQERRRNSYAFIALIGTLSLLTIAITAVAIVVIVILAALVVLYLYLLLS